jgi:hypothetical protein
MGVSEIVARLSKGAAAAVSLILFGLTARYLYVQNEIKNATIEITQYSKSGYTPPDVYGHGNLESVDGTFGWYIYDISDLEHGVRKACVRGVVPEPEWDIDFIYSDGQWYKLRSGLGKLSLEGFTAEPPTEDWNGFATQMTFPVRKPDLPYRAKILFAKLKDGTQSPLDYLQRLKQINPTCADMPAP